MAGEGTIREDNLFGECIGDIGVGSDTVSSYDQVPGWVRIIDVEVPFVRVVRRESYAE